MKHGNLTRRDVLAGAIAAAASRAIAFGQERRSSALALARVLNRTTYGELPPVAVKFPMLMTGNPHTGDGAEIPEAKPKAFR